MASRSYRDPVRNFLLFTHRWMGIPAAAFLVVIALTGAVLVYERPVDRLLSPHLQVVVPAGTRLPLDSLVVIATRARPRPVPAGEIHVPTQPDDAARVQFKYRQVFLDPYRGTILGERGLGESLVNQMRGLHQSLFLSRIGRFLTVTATAISLLLTIGGVILWWPRKILRFRRATSWRRINFDLHNLTGIVGTIGILLFGATALAMELGVTLDPWYRKAFGDAPNIRLAPASPRAATPLSIDAIVRIGDAAVPGRLRAIRLPPDPHGTYRILKQAPNEYGNRPRNMVYVDGNDGRVRGVIDQAKRPLGTRVAMLMEDWHIASFAPEWSRIFGIVSCLMLAFSSATGPLIWWKPRRRSPRRA